MITNKTSVKTSLIQLAVAIAATLPFIGWYAFNLSRETATVQAPSELATSIKSSGGSGITLARYNQVQSGMSLSQVETIVGEGVEISRSEIPNTPLTISFQWTNADGSNMNAIFQDDKLMIKAQAGLK